ncbi:MAG TPA: phosphoribosylformylglycinamidine cyclo-ligase [Anaerolineae bacterium]|nr:phosphoribosylformylglycinamidine cyclo-ligase [Anaerolineae bacterium]
MSNQSAYAQAGVDIAAGQKATELMKTAVRATYTPAVLSDTGNFGGLFDIANLKQLDHPVLVASTDGVGTKTKVAAHMNRWDTIGQDLVNHCINDILVQGATPLFFLDYVASSKLEPEQIATIVHGMATACQQVGCALLGGETAEMPGVYEAGEVDVVGTVVGVVDKGQLLDGSRIQTGDAILALPSTGLHTNGYSLARRTLGHLDWHTPHPDLNTSPGEAMLAIHRCYLNEIQALRNADINIRGLAHITGGGLWDNIPRILPPRTGVTINKGSWPIPPLFTLIQQLGQINEHDMYHAFNMGIGMVIILPAVQVAAAQALLPNDAYLIGHVVNGDNNVTLK